MSIYTISVPHLLYALQSDDPTVWQQVTPPGFGYVSHYTHVPPLIVLPHEHGIAARSLDVLISGLRHSSHVLRFLSATVLAELGTSIVPRLVMWVWSGRRITRNQRTLIAYMTQRLEPPARSHLLLTILQFSPITPHGTVHGLLPLRVYAAETLADFGEQQAVGPLLTALDDPQYELRIVAAHALIPLDRPRAVSALVACVRRDRSGLAVRTLVNLDDPYGRTLLRELMHDRHAPLWARYLAAESMCSLGEQQQGTAVLVQLWHQHPPSANLRYHLVLRLRDYGGKTGLPALVEALWDPDPYVPYHAARVLGQLGYAEAVEPLIMALENSKVRRVVIEALGKLRAVEAVGPLLVAAQTYPDLVPLIDQALEQIGGTDAEQARFILRNTSL